MSIDINYKMILKESILTFTKVLKFISLFYDFILFYNNLWCHKSLWFKLYHFISPLSFLFFIYFLPFSLLPPPLPLPLSNYRREAQNNWSQILRAQNWTNRREAKSNPRTRARAGTNSGSTTTRWVRIRIWQS